MCDVCVSEGKNYLFINGEKKRLVKRELKKVYSGAKAVVKLCYVHDIDLFINGERKFLMEHKLFIKTLAQNPDKFSKSSQGF